jgi:ArsR family transcriptional regulator
MLRRVASALRVLAHPQRLQMVELLMERDHSVGELAEAVGVGQAACSQHLNLMRAHGVLASERNGREVHYRVVNPTAVSIIRCIHRNAPAE